MSTLPIRIIPRLDIKGSNLVKGVMLEGLRVLGDPEEFAEYYYTLGADELFYQDVVASLYEQNSLFEMIKRAATKIFVPLTVGGGIRSLDDINLALRSGADKVSINTAAVKDPNLIHKAVNKFGSSTIVVSIEAIKISEDNYLVSIDSGRELTSLDVLQWASKVANLGAGEIILTCVDREGTGKGFDINLANKIRNLVNIPIVIHGGAGNYSHVIDLCKNVKVDGICCASMFHYPSLNKLSKYPNASSVGNKEFLSKNSNYKKFTESDIAGLKKNMLKNKLNIRI